MGLSYLSKAPYKKINYEGRTYIPLASGGTISFPWDGVSSQYVVTERIQANSGSDSWPTKVTWVVRNEQSGVLMATRELWRSGWTELSRDTPNGWQGDHAAKFVQRVLQPKQSWKGKGGYQIKNPNIEQLDVSEPLSLPELNHEITGCTGKIEIVRTRLKRYVQSEFPDWRFEPKYPARQVFCIDSEIYVISALLSSGIYVDKLSFEGELLDQSFLSTRRIAPVDHRIQVLSLTVNQNGLSMLIRYSEGAKEQQKTILRVHVE